MEHDEAETAIRPCDGTDLDAMLAIINAAAEAYRGVIPAECWHDPYMSREDLGTEMDAGVRFSGCMVGGRLVGIMGVQHRGNADLIRHSYVMPDRQGRGVGSRLLRHLCGGTARPILIGTWRDAEWAIRFYEKHGFGLVEAHSTALLLRAYWTVPDRQIATSVVLASPPLGGDEATALVAGIAAAPPQSAPKV